LIKRLLDQHKPRLARICQDVVAAARDLPEKALEAHLEEIVRREVKRGEERQ